MQLSESSEEEVFINGMFRSVCLKLVRHGKVKDIYELDNGNLLFHFSDRISAFDIRMATLVPHKGDICTEVYLTGSQTMKILECYLVNPSGR
jgi:phosphoribosylaminoimidazole-succinocarboxamide synthase